MDTFFSSYGIAAKENEPLALVIFLMGNHILADRSILYTDLISVEADAQPMTYFIKAKLLNCFIENEVISSDQQEELAYLLSQITWNHCFFKGWVTTEKSQMDQKEFENISRLFGAKDFITNFFTGYFPEIVHSVDLLNYLNSDLYQLTIYYLKGNYSGLSIGVHIEGSILMKKILTPMIVKRLNSLNFITASTFDKSSHYDLVISNVNFPAIEKQGKYFYLMNHEFYNGDFQLIEEFISKIIHEPATLTHNKDLK